MQAVDPIDLLERKIAALELKVLPVEKQEEKVAQSVSEMLIQVNTLISSALSCREVVTEILNRLVELNEYLDPNFYESQLSTEAKRQFILAIYPEVRKHAESIKRLESLIPVLNSEHLQNVPSLVPKLEQLSLATLKSHEDSQQVSKRIGEALQQYNNIIYSLTKTFVQLDEILTLLEFKMKPKLALE